MTSQRMSQLPHTLTPFLYPPLDVSWTKLTALLFTRTLTRSKRGFSTNRNTENQKFPLRSHLNPLPEDYSRSLFADKCSLVLQAGSGGHGCVSFLREKFIPEGPPNGGDGGSGGNIYIQAVKGETSLHKLAHQRLFKATRGRNGQGRSKGGQRGEDVLIQVPVGTVVREVSRVDPVAIEDGAQSLKDEGENMPAEMDTEDAIPSRIHSKWIVAPSANRSKLANIRFPKLPRTRRSYLAALQPPAPVFLDLSKPMDEPLLLAAGAAGGLGNPHFVTKDIPRPLYATKGEHGIRMEIELELKLLADLGFVGLPNAGKSTLLRAITRSRARVGNWAFTTLHPNIGTVVLDNNHGRAKVEAFDSEGRRRTQFSIADIPGIVPEAHLDKGLGLDFLRHVERARVLAFVIDLGSGDAVETLKTLWIELNEFENAKTIRETNTAMDDRMVDWAAFHGAGSLDALVKSKNLISSSESQSLAPVGLSSISSRPWFVIATKADIEGTEDNFTKLRDYLHTIESGHAEYPVFGKDRWRGNLKAIPISAIRGEGVDQIALHTISLLSTQ